MYAFDVVDSKGSVLLVDDRGAYDTAKAESRGPVVRPETGADKTAADLADWLTDAGYVVDTASADGVTLNDFLGHDVVMVSCGGNFGPLSYTELRRAMVQWADMGGRIVTEGGEVAYASVIVGPYPDINERVLRISG